MFEQFSPRMAIRERAVQLALLMTYVDDEGREVRIQPASVIPMAKEIEAYIADDAA